jgi:hypothetical protein
MTPRKTEHPPMADQRRLETTLVRAAESFIDFS